MGFKKGAEWNGNRLGRKEGHVQKAFRTAIQAVEKKKGKSLLQHLIEQAFIDNQVLVAVGKKILPDKVEDMSELKDRIIIIRPANAKEVKGQTD